MAGVDSLVYNGLALDEFVFDIDKDGRAASVDVLALGIKLSKAEE